MKQYFQNRMLVTDIGKLKPSKRIEIKSPLHPVVVFPCYFYAVRIGECARTFRRAMEVLLTNVSWYFSLYIQMISSCFGVRQTNTSIISDTVWHYCATQAWHLNRRKAKFLRIVSMFHHVTRSRPLKVSTQTTDKICRLEYPTTLMGPQAVSGLCNILRHFALNFAVVAASLNQWLCKGQPKVLMEKRRGILLWRHWSESNGNPCVCSSTIARHQ